MHGIPPSVTRHLVLLHREKGNSIRNVPDYRVEKILAMKNFSVNASTGFW